MPLSTEVGLGPNDIVLDGDPAPSPKNGVRPPPQCLLWPNGWMDQDGTWHGGGPWSRLHCATWGPSSTSQKGGRAPSIFGPFLLWPNAGCMKMTLCIEVGLSPGDFVLDGDPAPSPKWGGAPNFWPTSIVTKRLHGSQCHLVRR